MQRLILYIIYFIFAIFLDIFRIRRRSRYREIYSIFDNYDNQSFFSQSADLNDTEPQGNWFTVRIRRNNALRKCRKFLTSNSDIYKLRNKNVNLVYYKKKKSITCYSRKNKNLFARVDWADHPQSFSKTADNSFEKTFDNICSAFDQNSNYDGIVTFLKFSLIVKEKTNTTEIKKQNEQKSNSIKNNSNEMMYVDDYFAQNNIKIKPLPEKKPILIDINMATEDELASLPGITVIIAKKAINYRKKHNGFKSINEFYKELNIKKHFQEQINNLITFGNQVKENNFDTKATNERIIDF